MIDPSAYEHIQFEQTGRVLTATLNRPEAMNAVNEKLHAELARLFADLSGDASIDIVVLTGAGKAFSAGGDVDYLRVMQADPRKFDASRAEAKRIVFGLLDCEKIVVAKLNGHAIGLGATLALLSDIIFAADHVQIADPHVKVGLVAGDGGALIWPQLVGFPKAKEFLFTGDGVRAPQAQALGLINYAVPAAELDAAVDAFVERLSSGAMLAIKYTKVSVNLALRQLAHTMFDASIAYEALTNQLADHLEGINAFSERRPAQFTGR